MATLVTSVHQFVRVPGHPPTKFSETLDWNNSKVVPGSTSSGWFAIYSEDPRNPYARSFQVPITENVYEQALFAMATARFAKFIERK